MTYDPSGDQPGQSMPQQPVPQQPVPQQPTQPQGFQQPTQQVGAGASAQTEPLAIAALVCAIGAWVVLPLILAIVALVLARQADRAIATSNGRTTGAGMATAARVLSWIQLALIGLVIVFLVAFAIGIVLSN